MRVRLVWPVLAALSLVCLVGCPGAGSGNSARVTGTVTHNGTPVAGAEVTFWSTNVGADGKPIRAGSCFSDASGKYAISGTVKAPLLPGEYKVVVIKYQGKPGAIPASLEGDPEMIAHSQLGGENTLPKIYSTPNTTKLTASLDPGKNIVDLPLTGS
jgi:hypothetical protein